MTPHLQTIARQFQPHSDITEICAWGSGNINHTFRVCCTDAGCDRFILQRINTQVFPNPAGIMQNLQVLCHHLQQKLQTQPLPHWQIPQVLCVLDGENHHIDAAGDCWRALSFIDGQTVDVIETEQQAQEVGRGLGTFHQLLSDLDPSQLVDTLPGFHITPEYLELYDAIATQTDILQTGTAPSPEIDYCQRMVADRRQELAGILETAKAAGKLPLRVMHGDPKVNNIMLDTHTGHAIALIDLDTVKPGLIHYDIGDCLRSACNPHGEETPDWQQVSFDVERCSRLLQGYLSAAQIFFTTADYDYLYPAIRLLPWELGLRFFTDYLAGNVYFAVQDPEHNLRRALVQFKLLESIEQQAPLIQDCIQSCQT
ncbi:MAG: aminoglycoside phosphotransferase family protein [Spirulina sp. SIO3F2]|nr:aminoglycoside phosphotransferase family protein [Spirulina sp. SIO3F2]